MVTVFFNYNSINIEIQTNLEEKMINAFTKFAIKSNENVEKFYFLYSGAVIENESTIDQVINKQDREKSQMIILVNILDFVDETKKDSFILSKETICPKCKSSIKMNMKDYKILLDECKNRHKSDNIILENFKETQKIDQSKIVCDNCKNKNKNETHNNIFFICLTCKINLCPVCRYSHDKIHKIINYDHKYYICEIHNNPFISYCENCLRNTCIVCEAEHNSHKITHFSKILPNIDEIKRKRNETRNIIDKFKENIRDVAEKEIFSKILKNLESYYIIFNDIINNYDINYINYEILNNLNEFNNDNSFINDLNDIINEDNNNKKNNKINILYNKICTKEIEEITIIYDASNKNAKPFFYQVQQKLNKNQKLEQFKENEIKLFSSEFVENNKDKCKIIYENKVYELVDVFKHENIKADTTKIQFTLKGINNVVDMSKMFYKCKELISLPDIAFWNTSKINNMSCLFCGCSKLSNISDISKWDTSNVTNMDSIFCGCESLKSLPNISKWDTSNVKNMSKMFESLQLESLPDISIWNTSNATNMSGMFKDCTELKLMHDISKWNVSNVTDISELFSNCTSLTSIPDISKWDKSNFINIFGLFENCSDLSSLPDISKWNTSNVTDMSKLFNRCSSLSSLPDISKWDTSKVTNFAEIFNGCEVLSSLPDISKWNTSNVTDMSDMFYKCKDNLNIPSKFKT